MSPQSLDQLVTARLLERKLPDAARVGRWLARSQRDLDLATTVIGPLDQDRAMAIAYEAGYRACAGLLDLAGYRVTTQPGHHRAAIDAATMILGDEHRSRLRRLDRARRFRNDALYGNVAPVGKSEFEQLARDVHWLLDRLGAELPQSERETT